jgi:hypothetical protein
MLDLMDSVTQLKESYRQQWLSQYTDYRLATALGRWDAEYEYWRRAQVRLNNFLINFKDGDRLPPLNDFVDAR